MASKKEIINNDQSNQSSDVAQTNVPVEGTNDVETGWKRGPDLHFTPLTPTDRAKTLVQDGLGLFDADEPSVSRQVVSLVASAVSNCPKEERVAFRVEGKLRCERLKQFSEMLFNEFIYQTATLK